MNDRKKRREMPWPPPQAIIDLILAVRARWLKLAVYERPARLEDMLYDAEARALAVACYYPLPQPAVKMLTRPEMQAAK